VATLRERVETGVSSKGHHIVPAHVTIFHHLFLSLSQYFIFSGHIDLRRACTSFHGKKGLKAQRLVAGKR
jgi:hypothetical protein